GQRRAAQGLQPGDRGHAACLPPELECQDLDAEERVSQRGGPGELGADEIVLDDVPGGRSINETDDVSVPDPVDSAGWCPRIARRACVALDAKDVGVPEARG